MHSADYAVAKCLSVCPSLPPSVTRRYCAETAKRIIRLFHHRVATSFYFFHTKRYGNGTKGTPMEASNASGYEKITICDQYIYLVNDISYKCKKLQFIHKLTASDTSKTAKITKR